MARGKRVPPHDTLSVLIDGKEVPVLEIIDGKVHRIMPEEEWQPISEKIAERVCRQMTDYYSGKALLGE